MPPLSRRQLLLAGSTAGAALLSADSPAAAAAAPTTPAIRYCLNTATIRGQKLPITKVVDLAGAAGYDGIEPWIDELDQFVKSGGNLADLRKQIADAGLSVEGAIGFAEWIVDDPTRRAAGLEEAKRSMDLLAAIGGKRIAASAAGATDVQLDPMAVAKRYGALLEVGRQRGVVPQVEVWGFSKTMSRLGEVALIATESGDSQACILADVYHLYKGGSDFAGLRLLSNQALQVFHMNDYPAEPSRAEISDAARVYPGDGVAPLGDLLRQLRSIGFGGVLSLELFNPTYYQQDPAVVVRTGLAKMKSVVAASGV